jgi:hypothetical protein
VMSPEQIDACYQAMVAPGVRTIIKATAAGAEGERA